VVDDQHAERHEQEMAADAVDGVRDEPVEMRLGGLDGGEGKLAAGRLE